MKIPKIFLPEKDLEKKTLELAEKSNKKNGISPKEVETYYWKFINVREKKKKFTVENVQGYFKELSYESALKIVEYEKEQRDHFLEGLADIP